MLYTGIEDGRLISLSPLLSNVSKYTLEYAETLHMDFKLDKTCKTYFFPPLLIKVTY